jgi:predicted HicB family RNase H-like nuclease
MEPEKEKMAMLVIEQSLHQRLKIIAAENGESIRDLTKRIVEKYLEPAQTAVKTNG